MKVNQGQGLGNKAQAKAKTWVNKAKAFYGGLKAKAWPWGLQDCLSDCHWLLLLPVNIVSLFSR